MTTNFCLEKDASQKTVKKCLKAMNLEFNTKWKCFSKKVQKKKKVVQIKIFQTHKSWNNSLSTDLHYRKQEDYTRWKSGSTQRKAPKMININHFSFFILKISSWDFPSSPVVRILRFHCKRHSFNPWLRNYNSQKPLGTAKKQTKKLKSLLEF